ncbi:hypothetical protein EDD27_1214 [Nonomuraea polychroma]|uniref:Peptidase inhibitor family I36 n=1 Tax=Nonomuraea polychroma TaxID=46176 RepID=A0A438LZB2_9ACTN|nr:hypothetical protein [Nonomuraea polychroma]RVX38886.1 hypothetical protein EDD27_1214 [Nonomuraea polychroma]
MKSIKRVCALTLAAAAILAPAPALADSPHRHGHGHDHGYGYGQASAVVSADGSIIRSRNIVDVWRAYRGTYCVVVEPEVDLDGAEELYARAVGRYWSPRSLSVQRGSRACGGDWHNTIAVRSHASYGYATDTAFYLRVS